MCTRPPVARAASIAVATAACSASGGREARKSAYAGEDAAACRWSGSSACTTNWASTARSASPSWSGLSGGNSGTPESARKALKPNTPAACRAGNSPALPGIAPPQKPTSTWICPRAASRLTANAAASTVGGRLLSGMSTMAVTPPAAAARVAVAKPSHSVRYGLVDVHMRVYHAGQLRDLSEVDFPLRLSWAAAFFRPR